MMDILKLREDQLFINRIVKEIDDLYRNVSRKAGVSDADFLILYTLRLSDVPLTQSELCSTMFLSKQTVNSALKKLEGKGYLYLVFDADNKKSKKIFLTEKGKALAAVTADKVISAEFDAFRCFSDDEAEDFLKFYKKYLDSLKRSLGKIGEK